MTLVDYMRQEKKEEEDWAALKTVLTHQYNNLKTTYKSVEEDWLLALETVAFWLENACNIK